MSLPTPTSVVLAASNVFQATDIAVPLVNNTTYIHIVPPPAGQTGIVFYDSQTLKPGGSITIASLYVFSLNLNGVNLAIDPVKVSASTTSEPTPKPSGSAGPTPAPSPGPTNSDGTPRTTAPPTTSGTSTPTAPPSPNNGLSTGAVAGVAVGCLLAGALIAGLLAFFFFRRKRRSGVRDSEASSIGLIQREKGPIVNAVSVGSGSPITAALENGLPLPLEDRAISGEISKISNLIKNHVQSYYHTTRTSPVMIDYDDLQALGSDLPIPAGALSTLLGNVGTREIALRFCIAWIVVSRMQLDSPPHATFLPSEVAQCFQAMALDRGSRGKSMRSSSHGIANVELVHASYFAKWRAITAELMQSVYVRNPFSATDGRLHNIQLAADRLNNILRPYSDPRVDEKQRSQNLEEILKRSALFAFTLFSQPSVWDFDWQDAQDVKSGSLCVFPALVQVTDENGELMKPARPFNEAVVRRLDE